MAGLVGWPQNAWASKTGLLDVRIKGSAKSRVAAAIDTCWLSSVTCYSRCCVPLPLASSMQHADPLPLTDGAGTPLTLPPTVTAGAAGAGAASTAMRTSSGAIAMPNTPSFQRFAEVQVL